MTWLDAPFFAITDRLFGLQSYFLNLSWNIAKIVMLLCLGLAALKYAISGGGLKDVIARLAVGFVTFVIISNAYPQITAGMNSLVYEWANGSTYETAGIQGMLQEEKGNYAFWQEKLKNSDVLRVVYDEGGKPSDLIIEVFDEKHHFISPNAVIRLILLETEELFNSAVKFGTLKHFDLGNLLMGLLAALAVLFCGCYGSLAYFIAALEFALVTSVGVILLPFMLWDGTKFLTEKLIGALLGFFVKMLFCTITMLFTFYGYLGMLVQPYDGNIEQIVYVIFSSLCYMLLCMSGPALAQSLLTGTPSLGMSDLAKAAGAYAGAGKAGKSAGGAAGKVAGGIAKAGAALGGTLAQAAGSAAGAKNMIGSKGQQAGAFAKSLARSAGQGIQSRAHEMGRSLLSSGGHIGGAGGNASGQNRFSQMAKLNAPNNDGQRKTIGEFLKERYQDGKQHTEDGAVKKAESRFDKKGEY